MSENEDGPVLRNYVIIGQMPEGDVVHVKHTVNEQGYRLYRDVVETLAREEFEGRFPEAVPVKPVSKNGTGGMGWSEPYVVEMSDE